MMNVAYSMLNIFAFIILIILMIIFFGKKRLHNIEDNTYGWLLVVSFFTIATGITLGFLLDADIVNQNMMIIIFNKLYLVGLITTLSMFVFYTYNISRFYKEEKRSRNMIIYSIFIACNIIVISLLPLNTFMADTGVMTKGLAMDYTSLLFGIIYTMLIIFCLIDFKHLKNKKYIPIILLILEGIAITIIQFYIPSFTIENGLNADGVAIDVINLCIVNDVDITQSNDYDEIYYPLPFSFPLKVNFTVTSIAFEHRQVDLGNISEEAQASTNFHSGWDLAVPTGTNFYSICDGTVSNITNTQANDLPFKQSGNSTGNYMMVTCSNGFTAMYWHLQYNSQPFQLRKGSLVRKGDLLGRTSTTGTSTGPHLHLGLKDPDGKLLDAISYIDFTNYEGN